MAKAKEVTILVINSKVKATIADRSGLRMSGDVAEALSVHIDALLVKAEELTEKVGRKTVSAEQVNKVISEFNLENEGKGE